MSCPWCFQHECILPCLCERELPHLSDAAPSPCRSCPCGSGGWRGERLVKVGKAVLLRTFGRCYLLGAHLTVLSSQVQGSGFACLMKLDPGTPLGSGCCLSKRLLSSVRNNRKLEPFTFLCRCHVYHLKAVHGCEFCVFAIKQVKYESKSIT